MTKPKLIVFATASICLLAAPFAFGQGGNPPASTKESGKTSGRGMTAVEQTTKDSYSGNVEQQITALSDQFTQAFAKADVGFMEKHFADEFTAIHSDGKLSTKAQEIDDIKSGNLN